MPTLCPAGAHYAALDDEIGIEKLLQNAETNGVDFNTIDAKIKTNSDGTCALTVQIDDFLKDESGQSASVSVKVDAKDNAKTVTQKVAEKAADSAASKVVEKVDSPAKRPASQIRWLRRLSERVSAAREADREPNRPGQ